MFSLIITPYALFLAYSALLCIIIHINLYLAKEQKYSRMWDTVQPACFSYQQRLQVHLNALLEEICQPVLLPDNGRFKRPYQQQPSRLFFRPTLY